MTGVYNSIQESQLKLPLFQVRCNFKRITTNVHIYNNHFT